MANLDKWTRQFKGENIKIVKGDYKGQTGVFLDVNGYNDVHGGCLFFVPTQDEKNH